MCVCVFYICGLCVQWKQVALLVLFNNVYPKNLLILNNLRSSSQIGHVIIHSVEPAMLLFFVMSLVLYNE